MLSAFATGATPLEIKSILSDAVKLSNTTSPNVNVVFAFDAVFSDDVGHFFLRLYPVSGWPIRPYSVVLHLSSLDAKPSHDPLSSSSAIPIRDIN